MKNCFKCKLDKSFNEFNKRGDKYQSWCKSCRTTYHSDYWKNNPDRRKTIKSNFKKLQKQIQINIITYLKDNPCVKCGQTNILTLEFDHLRDKSFNVSHAIKKAYGWETIKTEIDKCQILCANCHAIKTANDNKNWKLEWLTDSDSNRDPTP